MKIRELFSKIRRVGRALRWSAKALVRPMDDLEECSGPWPLLSGWKSRDRENGHPLSHWQLEEAMASAKDRARPESSSAVIRAGLVFVQGRPKGEVVWLSDGEWTLGTAAWSNVTIETQRSSERSLVIRVNAEGVVASAAWADAPMRVNGHATERAEWVDQDEIQFENAQFYFLDLRGGAA